jgi:hypothetical protein
MAKKVDEVFPIVSLRIGAHPSGFGVLHIRSIPGIPAAGTPKAQIDKATQSHHYGIDAKQCTRLAQLLLELAGKLRAAKAALN